MSERNTTEYNIVDVFECELVSLARRDNDLLLVDRQAANVIRMKLNVMLIICG
jgi:hypothetical protein